MKQITEKQMELADKIYWLFMDYVNQDEYIIDKGTETENTQKGTELYYEIEDLLTKTK